MQFVKYLERVDLIYLNGNPLSDAMGFINPRQSFRSAHLIFACNYNIQLWLRHDQRFENADFG